MLNKNIDIYSFQQNLSTFSDCYLTNFLHIKKGSEKRLLIRSSHHLLNTVYPGGYKNKGRISGTILVKDPLVHNKYLKKKNTFDYTLPPPKNSEIPSFFQFFFLYIKYNPGLYYTLIDLHRFFQLPLLSLLPLPSGLFSFPLLRIFCCFCLNVLFILILNEVFYSY